MRAPVVAVALQVAVKTGAADAENLRCTKAIAVAHLKHFLDVRFTDLIQGKRLPLVIARQSRGTMLKMLRQIAEVDEVTRRRDAGGRYYVLEFTDISWPGMLQWHSLGAAGQTRDIFGVSVVVLFQEDLDQQRNVLQPLGARRDANLDGMRR